MSRALIAGIASRKRRTNPVAPGEPEGHGTYEPLILNEPDLVTYLPLGSNLLDASGNGQNGVEVGSGGSSVAALAPNVGATNRAWRTGTSGHLRIPHSTLYETDDGTEHSWPSSEVCVSFWARIHDLVNDTVVASKAASTTTFGDWWQLIAMENGSVHLQVSSPRCRRTISTPTGVVSEGTAFHVGILFGRRGLLLMIDGGVCNDGDNDTRHFYGWDYRWRSVRHLNDSHLRFGASGSSGNHDITFDEIAIYYHGQMGVLEELAIWFDGAPGNNKSRAFLRTLAQASPTTPNIDDPIWSRATTAVGTGTHPQSAANSLSAAGGGTIQLAAGTHNWATSYSPPPNVRTRGASSGSTIVQLASGARIRRGPPSINSLTDPGGAIMPQGATSITIDNSISGDAFLMVRSNVQHQSLYQVSGSTLSDPSFMQAEILPVQTRNSSSITLDRPIYWDGYTAAQRSAIRWATATKHIALSQMTVQRTQTSGSTFDPVLDLNYVWDVKLGRDLVVHEQQNELGHKWGSRFTVFSDVYTTTDVHIETDSPRAEIGQLAYAVNITGGRDSVFHGATLDSQSWHALSMAGAPIVGAGDRWAFSLNVEVVGCAARTGPDTNITAPLDSHGCTTECRFLFNHCTNGGGHNLSGHRMELVGTKTTPGDRKGCWNITDGLGHSYVLDYHIHPDMDLQHWFRSAGNRGCLNNTFVRITYNTEHTPDSGSPNVTPSGNSYTDCSLPLPSDA